MKHLLLILTIGTAIACRPSLQKCNDLYGHCGRIDTLTRTVRYRDSTFKVKPDTLTQLVPFWRTDTLPVERFIERLRRAQVIGGQINYYWVNDSLLKVEPICPEKSVTVQGANSSETLTQTKTEYVEVMPGWVKWVGIGTAIFGFLMLFGLILALIRR